MALSLADIEEQARKLAANERAELAEYLLDSLRSSVSSVESAWAEEIEARVAAFDRGEIQAHLAEEVFAEARNLSR